MSGTHNPTAFPVPGLQRDEALMGMSLRDYFIAHAPSEPQRWFEPVMQGVMPVYPVKPSPLTGEERHELEGWGDGYYSPDDMKCPRASTYAKAFDIVRQEMAAWGAEVDKQRYIQWPAAWADAMLKARTA